METTQTSNQVFNVGDYVRTSKGKIGVIERPSCIEVGYRRNIVQSEENWTCLEKFYAEQQIEADEAIKKWSWSYPTKWIEKCFVSNQVKLGSKTYPIQSDRLQKLDRLRIRTQQGFSQHEVELPIADAKLLMSIYSRNNIRFAIV